MSAMDDLVTWLRAQLDEDEQAARRLPEGHRLYVDDDGCVEQPREQWSDGTDRLPNHHNTWLLMYDRAERLAEVEAKRHILDEYATWAEGHDEKQAHRFIGSTSGLAAMAMVIRLLAKPYAGREGWREEWRPT